MKKYVYVIAYGHLGDQEDEDSLETYLDFHGSHGYKLKQVIACPDCKHAYAIMFKEDII